MEIFGGPLLYVLGKEYMVFLLHNLFSPKCGLQKSCSTQHLITSSYHQITDLCDTIS